MVKTAPSNAGGAGSIPSWVAKIPHASKPDPKKKKMVHIKKKKNLTKKREREKMWLGNSPSVPLLRLKPE